MDAKLASLGYLLEPSRYKAELGYSGLSFLISASPTERYFDLKGVHLGTFDGRHFQHTHITRHGLKATETYIVCMGELRLETFPGDLLRFFSFGGELQTRIEQGYLLGEFTSSAPLFMLDNHPERELLADELEDMLAEVQVGMAAHEDELYSRLAKHGPYALFLAGLVSLQKRAEAVPLDLRHDSYHKSSASLNRAIQIVRENDGWDGSSPALEDLLSDKEMLSA